MLGWGLGGWEEPPTSVDPALTSWPGPDGGFWRTGSHGRVRGDGAGPEDFVLEFRARRRLAIRTPSGKYLRGGASGLLRADGDTPTGLALWEF